MDLVSVSGSGLGLGSGLGVWIWSRNLSSFWTQSRIVNQPVRYEGMSGLTVSTYPDMPQYTPPRLHPGYTASAMTLTAVDGYSCRRVLKLLWGSENMLILVSALTLRIHVRQLTVFHNGPRVGMVNGVQKPIQQRLDTGQGIIQ